MGVKSPLLCFFINNTMAKKVIKAENTQKKEEKKKAIETSLSAQERLAEILNDSPRKVSLNGSEWEIKALRMGTQWLIAQKIVEVNKSESATFGDIIKQFVVNIPALLDVLTFALLNDRYKIYEDGDNSKGFSDLYYATRDTLEWDCDVSQFPMLLLEVFQMIDTSFFLESHRMLQMFVDATMTRKTMIEERK